MELTAENVMNVLTDCLFRNAELADANGMPANAVLVEGITSRMGFHKERLESHREDVCSMLSELNENFFADKGGGYSFLGACDKKNGEQWGEHRNMEDLFLLGLGLGVVKEAVSRDMWKVLPGGMPYYVINLKGFEAVTNS
jgi:hypothetical protein